MAEKKSPMAFRLRKTFTQLTAFLRLRLGLSRRRPSPRLRSFSPDDRSVGLSSCLEDERIVENRTVRRLERASSSSYGNYEDDIDKRSQIFIDNFRRHLRLERQISLQLRYYRMNSSASGSGADDGERSTSCSPF